MTEEQKTELLIRMDERIGHIHTNVTKINGSFVAHEKKDEQRFNDITEKVHINKLATKKIYWVVGGGMVVLSVIYSAIKIFI